MYKKLIALVAGALLGLLVGATFNDLKAAPTVAGQPIGAVSLGPNGDPNCTATKIAPKEFLTAGHCVTSPEGLTVSTQTDQADVQYVTTGANGDWAVVFTDTDIEGVPILPLGCSMPVYLGQNVVAMGYPYPMRQQFTRGYVSALGGEQDQRLPNDFYLVMPGAASGSSGSAIVDQDTGLIIGILVTAVPTPRFGGLLAIGVQSLEVYGLCKK
jgi:hypothetical protein